jgi:GNAT superfamily N-acetyltransferase
LGAFGAAPEIEMLIRLATPRDVETLFDVRTSVTQNHQSREELAGIGITPSSIVEMLNTCCRAWIAEEEGQALAFSMADAEQGTVFAMFVRPDHERRGLGRQLMNQAEDWLFDSGWEEIWLLTGSDPGLRAVGFYHYLCWMPVGQQADGQTKYVKRRP